MALNKVNMQYGTLAGYIGDALAEMTPGKVLSNCGGSVVYQLNDELKYPNAKGWLAPVMKRVTEPRVLRLSPDQDQLDLVVNGVIKYTASTIEDTDYLAKPAPRMRTPEEIQAFGERQYRSVIENVARLTGVDVDELRQTVHKKALGAANGGQRPVGPGNSSGTLDTIELLK